MPFAYDATLGVFKSSSALSEERLSMEDVRRRGIMVSLLEVVSVDGVPYVYIERNDRLYRVGNRKVTMSGHEFYRRERGGTAKICYPHGEAFRSMMSKEMRYREKRRTEDRAR